MSTTTLKTVLEYLCDDFALGRYGTASAGATTSITDDTRFGGADGARDIDVGCAVYITYDAGGAAAAPEDEETRLSARPVLSTGAMTLDPAITAVAASDQFMVAYKPFSFKAGSGPYAIIPHVNQVLAGFQFEKRVVPITIVPDGDMLASAETDWTLSNATDAKTVASFPNGERVIAVTDSGSGGGYTSTGNIAVEEQKSYYLEVTGFGTDSSDAGSLVLYDVTNGAAITLTNSVIDRIEPERLVNTVTIPADCEQVDIRLTCTNASDVVSWGNLIFRKCEAQEFTLADRPQSVMEIGRLLAPSTDAWSTRATWTEIPSETEQLGQGLWRIRALESVSNKSLWYEEFIAPAAMTTAAGTTTINARHLAAVTAERLLKPLRGWSKEWGLRYDYAKSEAAGVVDRYLTQNRTVVNSAPRRYPTVRV